jgi:hypothetical protein
MATEDEDLASGTLVEIVGPTTQGHIFPPGTRATVRHVIGGGVYDVYLGAVDGGRLFTRKSLRRLTAEEVAAPVLPGVPGLTHQHLEALRGAAGLLSVLTDAAGVHPSVRAAGRDYVRRLDELAGLLVRESEERGGRHGD